MGGVRAAEAEITEEEGLQMDPLDVIADRQTELRTVTTIEDRNCLSFWFPKIQDKVPVPRTHLLRLGNGWELASFSDGVRPRIYLDALIRFITDAADDVGWPAFLRTGQGSGKHQWTQCCFLSDRNAVESHVFALVEWSHLVDMLGLPHDVWVVRELLPTCPAFNCTRYGGMPVVRERRYFVDGARVLYSVPYWPEGALEEGRPSDPDWRRHLESLDASFGAEGEQLASLAGAACGGQWSVDVLETERGLFVTDMAEAERSYGWDPGRTTQEAGE